MLKRLRRPLLAAIVLAAVFGWKMYAAPSKAATVPSAAADADVAVTRRYGQLSFSPCSLVSPMGTQSVDAQCSALAVPENRADPNSRTISLAIAWVPAHGEAQPDPVFMLAGGPGQAAREAYPGIAAAFSETLKKRDLVLVDQRGTGGSNALTCKDSGGKNAFADEDDDTPARASVFAARCAQALAGHADPRYYSTTEAIEDLDAVRAALGAERINLIGVSYGTRVAQQYAKRYPQHTRTVALDGVVPNSLVLGNEHAKNLESSLDRQFARCLDQKGCGDKLGNPRERLNALLTLVDQAPPTVHYRDGITGEAREEKLTRAHIATLARMFAYAPTVAGLLPLELNEAAQGRYEPLMALSKLIASTVGDQLMHGMELSVICTEDADELRVDPADQHSLIGTDLITFLQAQCAVWPHGRRPADFRAPLTGKVPVLLMSGEFDPVTPPRYAEEVLKSLTNGRHLLVRGQGHNVLPVGCMPKLYAKFLDSADPKSLDAACLADVPYAQPFTGFYGWDP